MRPRALSHAAVSPRCLGLVGLVGLAAVVSCASFGAGEGEGTGGVADGGRADAGPPATDGGPTLLATAQKDVVAITAAGDTVYWAARGDGAVRSCSVAACSRPTDLATGGAPNSVAWSTRLLWTDDTQNALFFLDESGKRDSYSLTSPAAGVTADARNVFVLWNALVRVSGDPPSESTTFLPFESSPKLGATHQGIAWATDEDVRFCATPTSSGCTEEGSLVSREAGTTAVALDDMQILWTTADGRLRARERAGGSISDLAAGLPAPRAVATNPNGGFVYVTSGGTAAAGYADGFVAKVPRGGGALTVVAANQRRPGPLAIAGGFVVWASSLDGTLLRAPE